MLMSGGSKVESFDPANGELLWSADAPWLVSCGTPVWDDECVYVSGGYPAARTLAIKADDSGELVWENVNNCYEQSMLIHDGYVYGTTESGFAFCYRANDGEEMWKERMDKKISASPVLAGGNLFVSAENGTTYVFKATPEGYEEVSQNQLGNTAYATPTFVRNRILARVATGSGKEKQEHLYCIGSE
jgi:outer membrane protein assembly factor BamB